MIEHLHIEIQTLPCNIYIYIYVCVCVCVCIYLFISENLEEVVSIPQSDNTLGKDIDPIILIPVNSRVNYDPETWYGHLFRKTKTLNSNLLNITLKTDLVSHRASKEGFDKYIPTLWVI